MRMSRSLLVEYVRPCALVFAILPLVARYAWQLQSANTLSCSASDTLSIPAAFQYDPGWNLIFLPSHACLVGASEIFTMSSDIMPPYTIHYDSASSVLSPRGKPAWVYFPAGGSLHASQGTAADTVLSAELVHAGFISVVSNPSLKLTMYLNGGANEVWLYSPTTGYMLSNSVPPGQAGFVIASEDTVYLTFG